MEATKDLSKLGQFKTCWKKNMAMYLFLILPMAYFIIFKYIPMTGNIIAFRKFVPGQGYFGIAWKGWYYFKQFIGDGTFWKVFVNTVIISGCTLLIAFPLPIIFALLLNEISNSVFKKMIQSLTIIPKFLSTVVVVMIINTMCSPSVGIINMLIEKIGGNAVYFVNESKWFIPIYIISDLWQFMGWNSIIYMAILSSVDVSQYEAAMVDGANRWVQTLIITLPAMLPTIAINLTISVGLILNVSFEKILLLYLPSTYDVADVISTYVYRIGLQGSNYSYGTAVGLFQGLIGLILLWITNRVTNKIWHVGLW